MKMKVLINGFWFFLRLLMIGRINMRLRMRNVVLNALLVVIREGVIRVMWMLFLVLI